MKYQKNVYNNMKQNANDDESDFSNNIPTEDSNVTLIPTANVNILSENK